MKPDKNSLSINMKSDDTHNTVKWSEEVWERVQPLIDSIMQLPFVQQLADGTLSRDRFCFYLQQDSIYLYHYCKVLAHIASRLEDMEQIATFLDFARTTVVVEQGMHQVFLAECGAASAPSPSCRLYTAIQQAQATAPVEVETSSVLPCFWVYQEVGKRIAAMAVAHNPYAQWIATYSDEAFEESTRKAIAICDALAEEASPKVREEMTRIFVECTKMEWLFWQSAYEMEQWAI